MTPKALGAEFSAAQREARRLLELELARVRLVGHEGVEALVTAGAWATAVLVLAVVGVGSVAFGAIELFSSAWGPWQGKLVGGLLCCGAALVGLAVWRARRDARFVAKLGRSKPGGDDETPGDVASDATPAAAH
ncbi:hypothetical protein [Engelhardtia mirabilis]|uniref:hypothetical protein n=1 Tax=Engelhardtia mirabilis TaxID=2528011 RepID=UPI0011A60648